MSGQISKKKENVLAVVTPLQIWLNEHPNMKRYWINKPLKPN